MDLVIVIPDAADFEKDPRNAYLWKFDRRRLEAEEIRDSMLAVSGQLDPTPGGPHPFPPVYQWSYSQHRQFFAVYDHNKRSVYLMQQRLRKNPILEVFDPAFFIDFKLEEKDPIKLVGAPAACQLKVQRPGEADVKKLTEEMVASGDQSNYGAMYANKIFVNCP